MSRIDALKNISSKKLSLLKSLLSSSHLNVFIKDIMGLSNKTKDDETHLKAAIDWLCKAQDITGCGGVAGGYNFTSGWREPYPETTGYIISTFLNYYKIINVKEYFDRALRMGDWEIDVQLSSGGVLGGVGINDKPVVFNTGQVIIGWTALFNETKDEKYLEAAVRAADWLLRVQDEDGKWTNYTYENIPHNYHTRVAWPILTVYEITKEDKYKFAAEKNIKWTMSFVNNKGWFSQMAFKLNDNPLTHTIAYTLRGLLESSFYLDNAFKEEILKVVKNASENIISKYSLQNSNLDKIFLPGTLDENWDLTDKYSCLTGDAQLAIIWLKLYEIDKNTIFKDAAINLIEFLKSMQNLKSKNHGINGAIPGSFPIWGKYQTWAYPNWATKFFADALILKKNMKE